MYSTTTTGSSSSLVFSLSIPLYKASNFTKLKSNRIQMRQLDQNRIDTERKLNMQITSYQDNMAASSEQVSSNKENVMQAEKRCRLPANATRWAKELCLN